MSEEHPNCQAVDRFLLAVPSVARPVVRTQNVDDRPVANGYTASWFDQTTHRGFTIIAMNDGDLSLYIEGEGIADTVHGKLEDAKAFAGRVNRALFP